MFIRSFGFVFFCFVLLVFSALVPTVPKPEHSVYRLNMVDRCECAHVWMYVYICTYVVLCTFRFVCTHIHVISIYTVFVSYTQRVSTFYSPDHTLNVTYCSCKTQTLKQRTKTYSKLQRNYQYIEFCIPDRCHEFSLASMVFFSRFTKNDCIDIGCFSLLAS